MPYIIEYYSDAVQDKVMALPKTMLARYFSLTDRMEVNGPNLGRPHTESFGDDLCELRIKGAEGIARVFFCSLIGRRIMVLHVFIKKSEKTPLKERRIAEARLKEVKNADAQRVKSQGTGQPRRPR
ncbi:MAG: type II toxin-antitoxin system RelE/ParE family toxin [Pseudomonadales bacterium]|jgi:phage-related protein|nr:type II toxin-antitoxin system RelE/ParE family toxin [Pseudomonadales bacterium]